MIHIVLTSCCDALVISLKTIYQSTCLPHGYLSVRKYLLKYPFLLASISVMGLLLIFRQIGGLDTWEMVIYDYLTRRQSHTSQESRILVVEITEQDIRTQQRAIMSDQVIAETLASLQMHNPAVVGLDIFRDIPQPPGNTELREQLKFSNVVVINELGDLAEGMVPAPDYVLSERVGFNDFVLDPDDILRRHLMYAFDEEETFYSFSLRLSLKYLEKQKKNLKVTPSFLQIGETVFPRLRPGAGGYQSIDTAGYQVLLRYRSPDQIAHRVSLTEVLNGQFDPASVENKIVLIGTTARTSKDYFSTPYSASVEGNRAEHKLAGVLVHAQLTSQILSTVLDQSQLIWFWPEWMEIAWMMSWALIGGTIAWWLKHPMELGSAVGIALTSLFGVCWMLFVLAGWVPFVAPALSLVITAGCVMTYRAFHVTHYDALTGLPNRSLFLQQAQRTITTIPKKTPALSAAILFLDLNRFKVINESFGHQAGDQLLIKVARRIKACVPPNNPLARVGGNEFVVLLSRIKDAETVAAIADEMQAALNEPICLNNQEIFMTTSVGIAMSAIEGREIQADTLLRDAHTAMYRAKALGKSRQLFANSMHTVAVSRLQLESELRQAIKHREFVLNYQPIVSLKTGRIKGFEALVRWQHPKRGFVSPGQFIPVAEETGLIIPMGRWILEEACRQMHGWHQKFSQSQPLVIGVNLSSRQFTHPKLIDEIEQILVETQLDHRTLKLEITESMAMSDVESAIDMLLRLKKMNLTLSIDDFGTGYSSLSYLHRFPTDILKVDRSFVSRMENGDEDAEIVKTIISLGHNLGMGIVAEGVETESQLETLRLLGCEYGQGYFFAKPMAAKDAEQMLERSPTW
ncbi:MAG: EAL domain-containing protein [Cyanobacteria bacterium P01_F01_bin.150]